MQGTQFHKLNHVSEGHHLVNSVYHYPLHTNPQRTPGNKWRNQIKKKTYPRLVVAPHYFPLTFSIEAEHNSEGVILYPIGSRAPCNIIGLGASSHWLLPMLSPKYQSSGFDSRFYAVCVLLVGSTNTSYSIADKSSLQYSTGLPFIMPSEINRSPSQP
jgi:hypothetical protein